MSKVPINFPFVCRKSVNSVPDLTPVISNLSVYSSTATVYTIVYIYGNNFSLYGTTGTSVVNFGNYTNLPVSFFSSQELSFSVPQNAISGNYSITVMNVNYPLSLVSNSINYTIL